ncbi:type VII secretion protein EssB [Bacillus sp. V33-4]|uniref:type VII secretion protein EssB n=1 Tax=Bacillus sp. V33-4 TaxID=2054169 RepID=UPI000C793548|nr:type VII secretion protein EssB [Bacillus sp. V33-4]PLR82276.1 type VII secretion protein EssB [Bacillus sp. V33-4]
MSEQNRTYLEEQLEAVMKKENHSVSLIFQREKIKLDNAVEVDMLKDIEPSVDKNIHLKEDELRLELQPPSNYITFTKLKNKDAKSKWIFASQLLKKIMNHSLSRLHIIVCPENIVIDESLTPYFLHYGVKESLPPYEKDQARLWQEIKATVSAAVDGKFSFEKYLRFHETLELSPTAAKVMAAQSEEKLLDIIRENITLIERMEKDFVRVTQKKWNITRYTALGLVIALLPALIFSVYSLIFAQPKQAAFIDSQEHYLKNDYSEVVGSLANYDVEDMPRVVQYQLAGSYIVSESLSEDQRKNVLNTVTLQADPQYYQYWIHIGRGNAVAALEIARSLEDRDLIVFGLLKHQDEVKADEDLTSDEKQKTLDEIKAELDEYEDERKALEEEEERRMKEEQTEQKAEDEPAAQQQSQQQQNQHQPNEEQPAQDPATTKPADTNQESSTNTN